MILEMLYIHLNQSSKKELDKEVFQLFKASLVHNKKARVINNPINNFTKHLKKLCKTYKLMNQ
jgi:hypothetical protein